LPFVILLLRIVPSYVTVVFLDAAMPSNPIIAASEEIISFHDVDIVTPSQKLLATQLSCDVSQGKSLLVTGTSSGSFSS
jgi:ABC-type uncharacterized transport system fused permease/ATPase subunit